MLSPFPALDEKALKGNCFMDKNTPVIELKGVGEKTQTLLTKLNIKTVGDLLASWRSIQVSVLTLLPLRRESSERCEGACL